MSKTQTPIIAATPEPEPLLEGVNIPPTLPATKSAAAPEPEGKTYLVKRTIVYQGPGPHHDQFIHPADNMRLTFDHLSGAELALLLKRGIIAP